jgi:hypothetical protein
VSDLYGTPVACGEPRDAERSFFTDHAEKERKTDDIEKSM